MTDGLTCDGFLGGRVRAWQPRMGYRAATDPVFLAAACPASPGQSILELGLGVGVASLCLNARVPDLRLVGVEVQGAYAALARRNALENAARLRVVEADIADLPADLKQVPFDHVIANPPYYGAAAGTPAQDDGREVALRESTPPETWIATAKARLRPKGWLTVIIGADRVPAYLSALTPGFGAITILPLQPRIGRAAGRVILAARKGAKAPFTLLPPLILHAGERHETDGDSFSEAARNVLREGAPLPLAPGR